MSVKERRIEKYETPNGIVPFDEWFEIEHKGKPAGKIHLRSEWTPKHGKHGFK